MFTEPQRINELRERLRRTGDHRQMIQRPEFWPHKVLLPLIRGSAIQNPFTAADQDLGFITSAFPLVVVLGNMVTVNPYAVIFAQELANGRVPGRDVIVYESVDELLMAGWVVD